jgi:hypothetical protein
VKIRSLQDLGTVQKQIAQARALQARQEAARVEDERRAQSRKNLFAQAVKNVQPLPGARRALAGRS